VIDEQPRQVEDPGEPGHHEHDVKGLQPQHGEILAALMRILCAASQLPCGACAVISAGSARPVYDS
jgi:hypothetical protein